MFYFIVITLLTLCGPVVADRILNGDLTQGGMVFGETKPGFEITFDGKPRVWGRVVRRQLSMSLLAPE